MNEQGCRRSDPASVANSVFAVEKALLCFSCGQLDPAIVLFDEALRLNPHHSFAYFLRGSAWLHKSEAGTQKEACDRAIMDFDQAIRCEPGYTSAYQKRGVARYYKQDYDRAIMDFNEVIRLSAGVEDDEDEDEILDESARRSMAAVYYLRGEAWAHKAGYENAIADYDDALTLHSEQAEVLASFAWLLATCPKGSLRDAARAIQLATMACMLTDWKDCWKLSTLAAAYAEAGHFEQAVRYQTQALADSECHGPSGDTLRRRLESYRQKRTCCSLF